MKPLTEHQWALIDAMRDPTKELQGRAGNSAWQFFTTHACALEAIARWPEDCRIKPEPRKEVARVFFSSGPGVAVTYYPDEPDRDKRVVATLEDVSVEKGVKP